jgi:hypothetical protein
VEPLSLWKQLFVTRKRWTLNSEVTPELLRFREKRKWQINLRRYVIERSSCPAYAPYFGLDIENLRKWFEFQFKKEANWENFAKLWQFDHIIPVTCFDFSDEAELKMCWNFTNLRVEHFKSDKDRGNRLDVLGAKAYFKDLYAKTHYKPCLNLLQKIDRIEISELISTDKQQWFILEKRPFLEEIEKFSPDEFELLNRGYSLEEIKNKTTFLKKFGTNE